MAFKLQNAGSHLILPFAQIFLAEDGNVDVSNKHNGCRSARTMVKRWRECHSRVIVATSEMCLHTYKRKMTAPNADDMHFLKQKFKKAGNISIAMKLLNNSGEVFHCTDSYVASAFVISSA